MKIVSTIEARMTSSRLPGKVLMPALGKPMLEHLVTRLRKVPSIHEVVLATTVNKSDDVLEDFAKRAGITCFRGSENDVMGRVIGAADLGEADVVVEITGDCPIIDSGIVEQTIQKFLKSGCDYCGNSRVRSYPDGMDVQIFPLKILKKSYSMTTEALDREHVTRHIILHPELFSQIDVIAPQELYWPELGLTLDEPSDYLLLKNLIEYFGESRVDFSCAEVIHVLKNVHPEWLKINESVKRTVFQ